MPGPFAALTIVRDEPLYLPLWCSYYTPIFGEENCFVLDNDTVDGSVDAAKQRFPGINVEHHTQEMKHNTPWLRDLVRAKQHELLKQYQVVIFAEADEFLMAMPGGRYRDLKDACEQLLHDPAREWIRADAWQCVQQRDEPGVSPVVGTSAFADRTNIQEIIDYEKVLVSKVPLNWTLGFHSRVDNAGARCHGDPIDHDLALFHAWLLDEGEYNRRHKHRVEGQVNMHSFHQSMTQGAIRPVPEEWRRTLVW